MKFSTKTSQQLIKLCTPKNYLQDTIHKAVSNLLITKFKQYQNVPTIEQIQIERAREVATISAADYQCNIAMRLSKSLKTKPEIIAEEIIQTITKDYKHEIATANASGPGFINLRLHDDWIGQHSMNMATQGVLPTSISNSSKEILIDFASPNMGKELHVGHLRSSVIGDTISRIYEFLGHKVTRISHVGDSGAAIASLLAYLESMNIDHLKSNISPSNLSQFYEESKRSSTESKQRIHEIVLELQKGKEMNSTLYKLWSMICESSRHGFNEIYQDLNVDVLEKGESTYLPLIPFILNEFKTSNLARLSKDALCIFIHGDDKSPMIIQKKDGGYLYATTDLAAIYTRLHQTFENHEKKGYDHIIYVTDQSQTLHFQQLFEAAKLIGWYDSTKTQLDHIGFGIVQGIDGKKLSSRKGGIISLRNLLNEAAEEAGKIVSSHIDKDDLHNHHKRIGNAAVRYYELSQHRNRNYQFSYDKVLNRKGNTAIYLMYASARLQSIFRNYQERSNDSCKSWHEFLYQNKDQFNINQWKKSERSLALAILQFQDELDKTANSLCPHYLCDYVYHLGNQFHLFYENCRVLDDQREKERLILCAATFSILETAMNLLGVETIDRL